MTPPTDETADSASAFRASGALVAPTRPIARLAGLSELLGRPIISRPEAGASGVIAWGYKPSASRSAAVAARAGLPLVRVEDGFLRSVGLGQDEPPLSIVVDDSAIYYDAASPSQLERLIAEPRSPAELLRARALIAQWRDGRVSKYNHAREATPPEITRLTGARPYVLVVDQTVGDASIRFGSADLASFHRMLDAALAENPDCAVVLKIHPDVVAGRKRGHFDLGLLRRNSRIVLLSEDVHPVSLIEHARAVYVVTSQVGFEALLWGRRVRTFGMPFYAGWGLTADELPPPQRRHPVALENLVFAALIHYPRYIDPEHGRACEVERVVEWMALQRRMRERFPRRLYALGFSHWKRPMVRSFLQGSAITFVRSLKRVPPGSTVVIWGRRPLPDPAPAGIVPIRLEDGFLRSVGLGADLVRPLSWVIDGEGIYYDATRPSELETLLQYHAFCDELLKRAGALRAAIVRHGLTKYNVGSEGWIRPEARGTGPAHAKRVILVPGQVERDASIRFGGAEVRTNLGLLQAVRRANPDAYIVYKPHPDVRAGLRAGGAGEAEASDWCDEVVGDVPMQAMLAAVDELHVLTSLAGFEALLRGIPVVTYGRPFYAGWGLTRDMSPPPRRTRRLTLDELVAGVLIAYPTYVSRITGRFTTPERALEELLAWRASGEATTPPWWRKGLRWILRLAKG